MFKGYVVMLNFFKYEAKKYNKITKKLLTLKQKQCGNVFQRYEFVKFKSIYDQYINNVI